MEIWEPKPPGTLWACYGTPLPLSFFMNGKLSYRRGYPTLLPIFFEDEQRGVRHLYSYISYLRSTRCTIIAGNISAQKTNLRGKRQTLSSTVT